MIYKIIAENNDKNYKHIVVDVYQHGKVFVQSSYEGYVLPNKKDLISRQTFYRSDITSDYINNHPLPHPDVITIALRFGWIEEANTDTDFPQRQQADGK